MRKLSSDLTLSLATITIVSSFSFAACAATPPESIPIRSKTVSQLVKETAQEIDSIKDRTERFETLGLVCQELVHLSRDERQPLVDSIARAAFDTNGPDWIVRYGIALNCVAPQIVLEAAGRATEERNRDECLVQLVRIVAERNPALASRALLQIKDSKSRAQARYFFARHGAHGFFEAKEFLSGGVQRVESPTGNRWPNNYAAALSRFVETDYEDVIDLIRNTFGPLEAIQAYCEMSRLARASGADVDISRRLMAEAAKALPNCKEPKQAAETLLRYGYYRQNPEDATALFDKYVLPKDSPGYVYSDYFLLLPDGDADVEASASRIAEKYALPREETIAKAWGQFASEFGPTRPLKWLRESPQTPLRDAVIIPIADGLRQFATKKHIDDAILLDWVDSLTDAALVIRDAETCWQTCSQITWLAHHASEVPPSLQNKMRSLWPQVQNKLVAFDRWIHFKRLLPDQQLAEINRTWQRTSEDAGADFQRLREVAFLVKESTLPKPQKQAWFERLLKIVRENPDGKERARLLTAMGVALASVDPAWALRVHTEELALAKKIGLQPDMHDFSDSLCTMFALANLSEVLDHSFRASRGNDDEVSRALWKFAQTQESVSDRNKVYAMLTKVLIRSQRYHEAAGVAPRFSNPTERQWPSPLSLRPE